MTVVVASPDDLVNAVSRDRRMMGYRVRRQGDGWIELEVVAQRARLPVLLVIAWPEVWRDAEQLAPHLVRARSGKLLAPRGRHRMPSSKRRSSIRCRPTPT
ncbi:MAG: hypothetical protein IPQ07_07450 [Myxococcales bacterium]|nr:hypothetical protein [Myxococcales bacterium]